MSTGQPNNPEQRQPGPSRDHMSTGQPNNPEQLQWKQRTQLENPAELRNNQEQPTNAKHQPTNANTQQSNYIQRSPEGSSRSQVPEQRNSTTTTSIGQMTTWRPVPSILFNTGNIAAENVTWIFGHCLHQQVFFFHTSLRQTFSMCTAIFLHTFTSCIRLLPSFTTPPTEIVVVCVQFFSFTRSLHVYAYFRPSHLPTGNFFLCTFVFIVPPQRQTLFGIPCVFSSRVQQLHVIVHYPSTLPKETPSRSCFPFRFMYSSRHQDIAHSITKREKQNKRGKVGMECSLL